MPRIVRFDRSGPYKIEPQDFPKDGKSMWICGCGLSPKMPYCDGTHKVCNQEQADQLYTYDEATKRVVEQTPLPPATGGTSGAGDQPRA